MTSEEIFSTLVASVTSHSKAAFEISHFKVVESVDSYSTAVESEDSYCTTESSEDQLLYSSCH